MRVLFARRPPTAPLTFVNGRPTSLANMGCLPSERGSEMFKHILVPTDGSPLSLRAAKAAVRFAKSERARIMAFHVTPQYHPDISGDYLPASFVSLPEFTKQIRNTADKYLGQVKQLADAAKVRSAPARASSDFCHDAIIKAAKANKCDLIFMASHGRRGLAGVLIGSETSKVLTHCKLPVLVYR